MVPLDLMSFLVCEASDGRDEMPAPSRGTAAKIRTLGEIWMEYVPARVLTGVCFGRFSTN
jgi:hypothetical protein